MGNIRVLSNLSLLLIETAESYYIKLSHGIAWYTQFLFGRGVTILQTSIKGIDVYVQFSRIIYWYLRLPKASRLHVNFINLPAYVLDSFVCRLSPLFLEDDLWFDCFNFWRLRLDLVHWCGVTLEANLVLPFYFLHARCVFQIFWKKFTVISKIYNMVVSN